MSSSSTFATMLARAATAGRDRPVLDYGVCRNRRDQWCGICHASALSYETEQGIKDRVILDFFRDTLERDRILPLIASPRGRRYRCVSKRRATWNRGIFSMGLIGQDSMGRYTTFLPMECNIESADHALYFDFVGELLSRPTYKILGQVLRYMTVKGEGDKFIVIFTVEEFSADVTRAMTRLSRAITEQLPKTVGILLIRDISEGQYYLGGQESTSHQDYRKIHGTDILYHSVEERLFSHHALSFTQINRSILPAMVGGARDFLAGGDATDLFDLYCGYGLFSITLASSFSRVTGVEIAHSAVDSAKRNAERAGLTSARFLARDITEENLIPVLRRTRGPAAVLLDPPRNGAAEGVLECIAESMPSRILHIFCNIDLVARDLATWEKNGYRAVFLRPFDSFPGTNHVEVQVGLVPEAEYSSTPIPSIRIPSTVQGPDHV